MQGDSQAGVCGRQGKWSSKPLVAPTAAACSFVGRWRRQPAPSWAPGGSMLLRGPLAERAQQLGQAAPTAPTTLVPVPRAGAPAAAATHRVHHNVCQLVRQLLVELGAQGGARHAAQRLPVLGVDFLAEGLQEGQQVALGQFVTLWAAAGAAAGGHERCVHAG